MVGAGQLARMTHQAAIDIGVELVVLAVSEDEPAVLAGATARYGRPDDRDAVLRLAEEVDVLTFDHEHVPADLAIELAGAGHAVRPSGGALLLAQDKLQARRAFAAAGLPVPAFEAVGDDPAGHVAAFAARHGWPVVLKASRGGYDGRGVAVVSGAGDIERALDRLGPVEMLVEAHVDVAQEIAVVGARSPSAEWAVYPAVGTLQVEGICRELVMPAAVDAGVAERAQGLARSIAEQIGAVGIIAVELFVTSTDELVVNEIALRPHNSGHATIEAAVTSQFHNHLRAVLDWPLGDTALRAPAAAMVNILGPANGVDPTARLAEALAVPDASVHLYGKEARPGRKLGHVTVVGDTVEETLDAARRCERLLTSDGAQPAGS